MERHHRNEAHDRGGAKTVEDLDHPWFDVPRRWHAPVARVLPNAMPPPEGDDDVDLVDPWFA
jgi:hypothetical protein